MYTETVGEMGEYVDRIRCNPAVIDQRGDNAPGIDTHVGGFELLLGVQQNDVGLSCQT